MIAHIHAEEKLRRSEERQRALLEAIPDPMFRINGDGVYLDFKSVKDIPMPFPPETFMGKSVQEVLPPALADMVAGNVNEVLQTGEPRIFEYELPINGQISQREGRMVVCGENEALLIVRDITDRKRAEEEIRKAHAELENAYNLQREFINNVTHEVRTPLTAVKGYA